MAISPEEFEHRLRMNEDAGLRNALGLLSHEKECALRYGHINESITGMNTAVAGVQRDIRAAAVAGSAILLAVLAFLVKLVFFA